MVYVLLFFKNNFIEVKKKKNIYNVTGILF